MADSQDQVAGEIPGRTSYGIDRPLPCPGCGYDLRGASPDSWKWYACPECGGNWAEKDILVHATQPYVSVVSVLLWTFLMPIPYAAVAFVICCTSMMGLASISASLPDLIPLLIFSISFGGSVLLMGLWNRDTAGRWASRMTQTPVRCGIRSGGWYWGTLLTVTAIQVVCFFLYPLLAMWIVVLIFA